MLQPGHRLLHPPGRVPEEAEAGVKSMGLPSKPKLGFTSRPRTQGTASMMGLATPSYAPESGGSKKPVRNQKRN